MVGRNTAVDIVRYVWPSRSDREVLTMRVEQLAAVKVVRQPTLNIQGDPIMQWSYMRPTEKENG